jgi:hypothetical protein
MRAFLLHPIFLFLIFSTPAYSQNAIPHDVVGGGGGGSSGGGYFLHDTIGQPVIGIASGASSGNKVGYWYIVDRMHIGPTSEILVTAFETELTDEGVVLRWSLGKAGALRGYNVYRSIEEGGAYERLNNDLIPYSGKDTYLDDKLSPAVTYWYKVGFVDEDGEFFSPEQKVYIPPRETTLYQNYPNPFNPRTIISFFVPGPTKVELAIFDVKGRIIRNLIDTAYPYGKHEIEWNGLDDRGEPAASGVYFYRMRAGNKVLTKKLTLLR